MIKDFWNKCHLESSLRYLTGSPGDVVWNNLGIRPLIKLGAKILNIGVGLGKDTFDLFKAGCEVSVLDISELALPSVSSFIKQGFLAEDIKKLPEDYFDLALSHLVSQHMNNKDLLDQMSFVIRGLKISGIFAMQIAYPLNNVIPENNESESRMEAGSVVRTKKEIFDLIEKAGGMIVSLDDHSHYPQYGTGWFIIHIMKR